MESQIENVQISKILIGDRQREEMGDVKSLAKSIDTNGLIQPIGINFANRLLWGGRRLAAYKHLKLTHIPAIRKDVKGEVDRWEIELLENSERKDLTWQERAMAEKKILDGKRKKDPSWNQEKQAKLQGEDRSAVTRRIQIAQAMEDIPEIADARNESAAWKVLKRVQEDAMAIQMEKNAKAKRSDAYAAGKNHYVVGDAFAGMEETKGLSYHFIECDPPYGIDLVGRKDRNKETQTKSERYTEIDAKEYPAFLKKLSDECFRLLKQDSFMIFWYGIDWHEIVRDTLKKSGFSVTTIPAIWYKGPQGQTASPDVALGNSYETFFVARKGQPKLRKAGRSNVFDFRPVPASQKIHPTQKPLDLMTELYQTFTYPGALTLIPFLGSGVSLYAAVKYGNLGHGYDLDKIQKTRFLAWVEKQEQIEDEDISKREAENTGGRGAVVKGKAPPPKPAAE